MRLAPPLIATVSVGCAVVVHSATSVADPASAPLSDTATGGDPRPSLHWWARMMAWVLELHLHGESFQQVHAGAVFGSPDFRVSAAHPHLARATVAFFDKSEFEAGTRDGWPTNRSKLEDACRSNCGPNLKNAMNGLLDLANGARASGVLAHPGVVVTAAHVVEKHRCALDQAGVVFDFEGEAEDMRPSFVPIERTCIVELDDTTIIGLAALDTSRIDAGSIPAPAIPLDRNVPWTGARRVMAFGHPLGSSRLATGDNAHTRINECDTKHRATLDSLMRSSGSPVYIPAPEGQTTAHAQWALFGILTHSRNNGIKTRSNGVRDIVVVPLRKRFDPCEGPEPRGADIVPLWNFSGVLDAFQQGDIDPTWDCGCPSPGLP